MRSQILRKSWTLRILSTSFFELLENDIFDHPKWASLSFLRSVGGFSSPDDGRISKKELEEVLSSQEARNERIFSGFSVATAYDGGSADLKHIKKKQMPF